MRHTVHWAVALLVSAPMSAARAELVSFTGVLELRASVGTDPGTFELLSTSVSGTADLSGGIVKIPAGALAFAVPDVSGFGGEFVNGPVTLSFGGAGPGPGPTCGLYFFPEICIDGGGFGGVMALDGVTHAGQGLAVWGAGGTSTDSTIGGVMRRVHGTPWTTGMASIWFHVPEIDPTPFRIDSTGSFRGLPSTFMGTGPAGFSLVTPMLVIANLPGSTHDLRAIARLRLDFDDQAVPVPVGGAGALVLLAGLLGVMGCLRLAKAPTPSTRGTAPR
jgi:hypothetical protein